MAWNKESIERLAELWQEEDNTYRKLALAMSKEFGSEYTYDSIRNYVRRHRDKFPSKERIDFIERGLLDTNYTAERTTVRLDSKGRIQEAYVKAIRDPQNDPRIIADALLSINPLEITMSLNSIIEPYKGLYVVPLFDMHLGVARYEDFMQTQEFIGEEIRLGHEKIIFAIGSDLIHNNDMKGNTANGTPIEQIDVTKAIFDAGKFYIPLLTLAIQTGAEVEVIYVKGNHDEMASWGFVHYLSGLFPQIVFDLEVEERKARLWNGVFVGFTHGDKASNLRDMTEAFINENTQIWSQATIREIYSGHLHKERVAEHLKTRVRILSTRAITDRWSKDRAFHSVKEFQTFVFLPNRRVRMVTV